MAAATSLTRVHLFLRCTAIALFAVYLGWQLFWLAQGKIPESLWLAMSGLPSPTTGGTRSLVCLLEGRFQASLMHNPLTVPIIFLFTLSVFTPLRQFVLGQQVRLPPSIALAWCVVLGAAWLFKLCQSLLLG